MRTLEHVVLSSRHPPNPTQRDPLNFIAPSPLPPYTLLLSAAEICIYPTIHGGVATPPLPRPKSGNGRSATNCPTIGAPSPPPPSRRFERAEGFERDKLSSFRSCLDSLISAAGITLPLLSKAKENTWRCEKGEGGKGRRRGEGRREESSPLGKRREHE